MKLLAWAGTCLLALLCCALPASAQHAMTSAAPAGWAPEQTCITWSGASIGSGTLIPCGTGGGGGGGAITAADGADTAEGKTTDAAGTSTVIGQLKAINSYVGDTTTPSPVSQSGTWTFGQLPASLGYKTNATSLPEVTPKSATGTSTNVTSAAASTLVLAANVNRIGCNITNDSTSAAYLKLGTGATSSSYDYYLPGSASGVPASFACPSDWVGVIYMNWVTANGFARVSERTP